MNAVCGTQAPLGAGKRTVFFEGSYIVYNGNKKKNKLKEMEREKNEFIENTSYCNHRI